MDCINWLNCSYVAAGNLRAHFHTFPSCIWSQSERKKWETLCCALVWSIWYCRNHCIFNNKSFEKEKLWPNFLYTTWSLLSGLSEGFGYSHTQWCITPGACINPRIETDGDGCGKLNSLLILLNGDYGMWLHMDLSVYFNLLFSLKPRQWRYLCEGYVYMYTGLILRRRNIMHSLVTSHLLTPLN